MGFLNKTAFVIMLLMINIISCTNVRHGYKIEDDMPQTLEDMVREKANINQIIATFGSPTFVNSPINDIICYVDAEGKKIAFNRFYKPSYRFLCISFEKQIATKIQSWTLHKIQKAKMVNYDTKFAKPL